MKHLKKKNIIVRTFVICLTFLLLNCKNYGENRKKISTKGQKLYYFILLNSNDKKNLYFEKHLYNLFIKEKLFIDSKKLDENINSENSELKKFLEKKNLSYLVDFLDIYNEDKIIYDKVINFIDEKQFKINCELFFYGKTDKKNKDIVKMLFQQSAFSNLQTFLQDIGKKDSKVIMYLKKSDFLRKNLYYFLLIRESLKYLINKHDNLISKLFFKHIESNLYRKNLDTIIFKFLRRLKLANIEKFIVKFEKDYQHLYPKEKI